MTDPPDIITRLRDQADWSDESGSARLMDEAAKEIERLRAHIEADGEAITYLVDRVNKLSDELAKRGVFL